MSGAKDGKNQKKNTHEKEFHSMAQLISDLLNGELGKVQHCYRRIQLLERYACCVLNERGYCE